MPHNSWLKSSASSGEFIILKVLAFADSLEEAKEKLKL